MSALICMTFFFFFFLILFNFLPSPTQLGLFKTISIESIVSKMIGRFAGYNLVHSFEKFTVQGLSQCSVEFLALACLNRIFLRVLYCLLQPVRDFLSFDEYGLIQMSSDNLMLFGAAFFVCVFF